MSFAKDQLRTAMIDAGFAHAWCSFTAGNSQGAPGITVSVTSDDFTVASNERLTNVWFVPGDPRLDIVDQLHQLVLDRWEGTDYHDVTGHIRYDRATDTVYLFAEQSMIQWFPIAEEL